MLSRPGIFRVLEGVAVDMCNRVFKLPSFHSMFNCSWETLVAFILQTCSNFDFSSHSGVALYSIRHICCMQIFYGSLPISSCYSNLING